LGDYDGNHYSEGSCKGLQFVQAGGLFAAKAKRAARIAGITAGCVLAAPLVLAGGAVVLVGGLIALPVVGAVSAVRSMSSD
jgi:protein involved in polysaccharide export with SLBB domain